MLNELAAQISALNSQMLYERAIEGRMSAEIANTLALTPDQVRFRVDRMKKKFRERFGRSSARDN